MSKITAYRETLRAISEWDEYLLEQSGLPGPRGNLELAWAVWAEAREDQIEHYLTFDPVNAPTNDPHEFLAFCGVLGLGRLISEGRSDLLARLRPFASDPRWRVREGVAMALQQLGRVDMGRLLPVAEAWGKGNWLEKRAAVAALAEPSLLKEAEWASEVLRILERVTISLVGAVENERRRDEFRVLRKALGYCWSVVVVAIPEEGKTLMEKWLCSTDADIRWIMRENLKKKRLARLDPEWVNRWQTASRSRVR